LILLWGFGGLCNMRRIMSSRRRSISGPDCNSDSSFSLLRLLSAGALLVGDGMTLNPDESALYEGVGRFITAFAGAEAGVHLIARKLSQLDDEIARALLKGMRLSDMTERVRALLRIKPEGAAKPVLTAQTAAIVEACLDQLAAISGRRHNLVHRASGAGATGIFVTNILNSKSSENAELEIFTLPELTAMTADCEDAFNQLDRLASGNRVNEALKVGVPAWRYKPAQPSPKSP
jgi:hypothetical protein